MDPHVDPFTGALVYSAAVVEPPSRPMVDTQTEGA